MNRIIFSDILDFCNKNKEEYKSRFKLIYLDPPYNTKRNRGARENYIDKNKNWSVLIDEVLKHSCNFLTDDGFLAISINQTELFNLKNISDKYFSSECFIGLFPIKIRHKDRQLMINATFHDVYEYLLIYRKNKTTRFLCQHKHGNPEKFIYDIEILDNNPEVCNINNKEVEIYKPNQYQIVKCEPESRDVLLRRYIIAGKIKTANWSGEWYEKNLKELGEDLLIKVNGLEQEGLGYRWFNTGNSKRKSGVYFQSILNSGRPILPTNDIDFTDEVTNTYKEGGEGCDYKDSKKPEKLINYLLEICTRPNDEVLDMFGGSGTTLAACIKNNRRCTIIDNNKKAIEIMKKRIENMKSGKDIDSKHYTFECEEVIK